MKYVLKKIGIALIGGLASAGCLYGFMNLFGETLNSMDAVDLERRAAEKEKK